MEPGFKASDYTDVAAQSVAADDDVTIGVTVGVAALARSGLKLQVL